MLRAQRSGRRGIAAAPRCTWTRRACSSTTRRMRIEASARQALAAMAEGDTLRTLLAALRRLFKVDAGQHGRAAAPARRRGRRAGRVYFLARSGARARWASGATEVDGCGELMRLLGRIMSVHPRPGLPSASQPDQPAYPLGPARRSGSSSRSPLACRLQQRATGRSARTTSTSRRGTGGQGRRVHSGVEFSGPRQPPRGVPAARLLPDRPRLQRRGRR